MLKYHNHKLFNKYIINTNLKMSTIDPQNIDISDMGKLTCVKLEECVGTLQGKVRELLEKANKITDIDCYLDPEAEKRRDSYYSEIEKTEHTINKILKELYQRRQKIDELLDSSDLLDCDRLEMIEALRVTPRDEWSNIQGL